MTRRRILVPIDFGPASGAALYYAGNTSTRNGDMLTCLHVIEKDVAGGPIDEEARRKTRRDAENRLSEMVHSILNTGKGVSFEIMVTSGIVHQKIIEKAVDLDAHRIVLGISGLFIEGEKRTGSNTEAVIAGSPVPVMVFSTRQEAEWEHLILPLDVSKPTDHQVDIAIQTAKQMAVGVSVLSVIDIKAIGQRPNYLEWLEAVRPHFKDAGVAVRCHLMVARKSIPEKIIAFSNRASPGIILLTHGLEPSIYREVIKNSVVPVLCMQAYNRPRRSTRDPYLMMNL